MRRRIRAKAGVTLEAARGWRCGFGLLLAPALLLVLALPAAASEREDALAPWPKAFAVSAREVLNRAFDNFYGCDLEEQLDFHVTTRSGQVMRHAAERIRKRIRGRTYDLFSIRGGTDRRDYRSLRIQGREGSDDLFAFVPSAARRPSSRESRPTSSRSIPSTLRDTIGPTSSSPRATTPSSRSGSTTRARSRPTRSHTCRERIRSDRTDTSYPGA